jgi:L-alanine-DL-glutamate epimerase-like enolase superfamily enzyme
MKITNIEAIPISVPHTGFKSSLGVHRTLEYGIVVVSTDGGIEGLGEISMIWDGNGYLQCHVVDTVFRPALLGEDPTAINRCLRKMDTLSEGGWAARAAVEMALFDIAGKVLNTPVYNLLGGKARDSIHLSRSVSMDEPDAMAERASGYVADGFTCVKVKIGVDPAVDARAVSAIREAIGPDRTLRVDANMGWRTAKDAIRAIKALEPYNLHSVEQPIRPGDLDALRLIRESVDVPIMVDESVWGPKDAYEVLRANAADMINVYVAESGGLTNASLIFRMAETVGVPCLIGAMPELGIGTAAAVHLGIAMTNLRDPCDACGVIYHTVDVIEERFDVRDGRIRPLDGPGLGVTLDRQAVQRFRVG